MVSSCGDDKDESNAAAIEGTWKGSAVYEDGSQEYFRVTFYSNGRFSMKYYDYIGDPDYGESTGTYKYNSEESILTLNGVDEDGDSFSDVISCTVSGNKMVWKDGTDVITFTKSDNDDDDENEVSNSPLAGTRWGGTVDDGYLSLDFKTNGTFIETYEGDSGKYKYEVSGNQLITEEGCIINNTFGDAVNFTIEGGTLTLKNKYETWSLKKK